MGIPWGHTPTHGIRTPYLDFLLGYFFLSKIVWFPVSLNRSISVKDKLSVHNLLSRSDGFSHLWVSRRGYAMPRFFPESEPEQNSKVPYSMEKGLFNGIFP